MQKEVPDIFKKILKIPFRIRLGLSGFYLTIIAALSLLPSRTFEDVPSLFEHMDKVIHFLMYGGMSAILCWTFPRRNHKSMLYFAAIVLFCVTYGIFFEILQGVLKELDRSFSWGDMTANIIGTITFIPIKELLLPVRLDRYETP